VSERSKDKVVHIVSGRSLIRVPPPTWSITYYDPKAFYKVVEVQFEDGKMSRFYEPTRPFGFLSPESQKPLDIEKLKIDSTDALRITLALPAVQEFIVESVEFELERGYGGVPVWRIRLFGASVSEPAKEKALGYAILAADDGKMLKETLSTKVQRTK
jgi:hypothetical protein